MRSFLWVAAIAFAAAATCLAIYALTVVDAFVAVLELVKGAL
ncbi:hypothetical protein [Arthrobacter sp. efr-133-R2A-63]|nr:hypothetical protein [Arthrobacter sp. efr-133-R2A-63]